MRFKPKGNRAQPPHPQQTMVGDREALPFPEGGVFSAKTSATRPSKTQPRPARETGADQLDALFNDIRSGLDDLGDLLDQPFRLPTPSDPDDDGPRRAA